MTITFGSMLNQMAGLFAMLIVGYCMNRLRLLPEATEAVLSKISAKIFLPCLMAYTFMEQCTVENLMTYSNLILYGGLFQLISMAVAVLLAKPLGKGDTFLTGVYRYALSFPNLGGFGYPTILALFGQLGLFQYQLYMLLNQVLCYVWGVGQMMPAEDKGGWKGVMKKLFNPVVLGIITGAVLGLTEIAQWIPSGLRTTVNTLGSCFTPISLILAGSVIANYKILDILKEKRTYIVSALRLILIPGAFLLVLRALHLPDMLCIMTCLGFACPCGVNTVVYPAAYGQDTRPGAGLTLMTSTLAVITIPILMAIIL